MRSNVSVYVLVARIWAVVFLVAGLAFAIDPEGTGHNITTIGGWLGLSGTVETGPRTMWWVLTVSLMATITVLSAWSAHEPQNPAPYVALMTSKLCSTGTFVLLAATAGPAWLVCAACDGSIALTLYLARRRAHLTVPRFSSSQAA
jgi:hypothetical protein